MFINQGHKLFYENFDHIPKEMCWYIAGFLDGEGYIGITKKARPLKWRYFPYYYDHVIKVLNTNKQIIDILEKYLGGYRFLRTFPERNQKDAHSLEWKSGSHILPMLKWLQPYLIVKKSICDLTIEFIEWKKKQGRYRAQKHRPFSEEEVRIMEDFHKRCLELNHKGKLLPPTVAETK